MNEPTELNQEQTTLKCVQRDCQNRGEPNGNQISTGKPTYLCEDCYEKLTGESLLRGVGDRLTEAHREAKRKIQKPEDADIFAALTQAVKDRDDRDAQLRTEPTFMSAGHVFREQKAAVLASQEVACWGGCCRHGIPNAQDPDSPEDRRSYICPSCADSLNLRQAGYMDEGQ